MLASIMCLGMDTRHPRVHVPAFAGATSQLCCVSLKAGLSTYKGHGADWEKAGAFSQQLTAGVDMTSTVKSGLQRVEVCMRCFLRRAWEEAEPVRSDG